MAVNKNGSVPVLAPTAATLAAAVVPSGYKFGAPTVFNSSGTYTVPATATSNSSILVECIGGGGAGGPDGSGISIYGNYNVTGLFGNNSTNVEPGNGRPGNISLGLVRLGFFSETPASGSLTVTVGAGGTGGNMNAQNVSINTGVTLSSNSGNAGGTSSVTFSGTTVASANGGPRNDNSTAVTSTVESAPVSSTALASFGPRGGTAHYRFTFTPVNAMPITANSITQGITSRTEFGGSTTAASNPPNNYAAVSGANWTSGTDGTAGTGQGGGSTAGIFVLPSAGSYTWRRGGNGAAPGGSGGAGGGTTNFASAGNYNFAATQVGGNGGAGRVRIWFAE
jgi:hypothetical protein